MNFKRWRMGLLVACVSGLFTVLATSLVVGEMTLKQFLLLLAAGIAKDGGLFLKQFPIDSLPPDKDLNGTTHFERLKDEEK